MINTTDMGQWYEVTSQSMDSNWNLEEIIPQIIYDFGLKLASFRGVKQVSLKPFIDLTTFITKDSERLRRKIYNIEWKIMSKFRCIGFDFHIVEEATDGEDD